MNNIDIKLIKDYIDGKEIDNVDELEKDWIFMKNVLIFSNDKKMYQYCSDEVKGNYNFINFLLEKYNTDLNFLNFVVTNYLNISQDEDHKIETILKMLKLCKKNSELLIQYTIRADAFYHSKRMLVELCKIQSVNNPDFIREIGMGFVIIFDIYNGNKLILDFFAKKFAEEIIGNGRQILKHVINNYKNFDELQANGINTYLINYIRNYDSFLAQYLTCNIDILSFLQTFMMKIKVNWNFYINQSNQDKVTKIYKTVYKYISDSCENKNSEFCNFDVDEIIIYIGAELGITDILKNSEELAHGLYNDNANSIQLNKDEMSNIELFHYNKIKEIMENIIKEPHLDEEDNEIEYTNTKIYCFKPRKSSDIQ